MNEIKVSVFYQTLKKLSFTCENLIQSLQGAFSRVWLKELVEMMSEKTKDGDAAAAYILSDLYFKGRGVPKDIRKAYELMKWSADKGYADAQYNMAGAYLMGDSCSAG